MEKTHVVSYNACVHNNVYVDISLKNKTCLQEVHGHCNLISGKSMPKKYNDVIGQ